MMPSKLLPIIGKEVEKFSAGIVTLDGVVKELAIEMLSNQLIEDGKATNTALNYSDGYNRKRSISSYLVSGMREKHFSEESMNNGNIIYIPHIIYIYIYT